MSDPLKDIIEKGKVVGDIGKKDAAKPAGKKVVKTALQSPFLVKWPALGPEVKEVMERFSTEFEAYKTQKTKHEKDRKQVSREIYEARKKDRLERKESEEKGGKSKKRKMQQSGESSGDQAPAKQPKTDGQGSRQKKKGTTAEPTVKPPPPPPPAEVSELRNEIAFGVNAVSRALEKGQIRFLVTSSVIDPPVFVQHLVMLAFNKKVPFMILKEPTTVIGDLFGMNTCVCFGFKVCTPSKFDALVEYLRSKAPQPPSIPWLPTETAAAASPESMVPMTITDFAIDTPFAPKTRSGLVRNQTIPASGSAAATTAAVTVDQPTPAMSKKERRKKAQQQQQEQEQKGSGVEKETKMEVEEVPKAEVLKPAKAEVSKPKENVDNAAAAAVEGGVKLLPLQVTHRETMSTAVPKPLPPKKEGKVKQKK